MDKRTRTTLTFAVTLEQPKGVTIPDMREYIKESIQTHKGGFDPEDELFDADFSDIKIHLTNKETKYA